MAQYGRPSAAQIAAEAERRKREEEEARVTASNPPMVTPVGQRALAGYRLVRTFSDTFRRPHVIRRKGEVVTDKCEVERLARLGAELEPVEVGESADEGAGG